MLSLCGEGQEGGGCSISAAEQGEEADEDVDDVEIDVEGAVHSVVDSLGVHLRLGDIVADVGGKKDDENPVECRAGVVEQEGGHQFSHNAYNKRDEKGASQAKEYLRPDQTQQGHGGSDDACKQQGFSDYFDRKARQEKAEHHAYGQHEQVVAEKTYPRIGGFGTDENACKSKDKIAHEKPEGAHPGEEPQHGKGEVFDHNRVEQETPKEG